jgi:hypothetical protein
MAWLIEHTSLREVVYQWSMMLPLVMHGQKASFMKEVQRSRALEP